jgi:hypothetical protein
LDRDHGDKVEALDPEFGAEITCRLQPLADEQAMVSGIITFSSAERFWLILNDRCSRWPA